MIERGDRGGGYLLLFRESGAFCGEGVPSQKILRLCGFPVCIIVPRGGGILCTNV